MSIQRGCEYMVAACKAKDATEAATDALRVAVERKQWGIVEALRATAVVSFEAMLDATIAAQREVCQ